MRLLLENQDDRNQIALAYWQRKAILEDSISVTEDYRYLTLTAANFTYRYDKFTGMFARMTYQGMELLDRPMDLNVWRAPTDNDRKLKADWFAAHYDKAITPGV